MGVGKSTTGRALADVLGIPYVDSDDDIARLIGCSGAEFAATEGVEALHRLEEALLLGPLSRPEPSVITAAASVVESSIARRAMARRAVVVRLTLSLDEALARQQTGAHRRPMSADELAALAARRQPFFSKVEDINLAADQPTDTLVAAIVEHLRSPTSSASSTRPV